MKRLFLIGIMALAAVSGFAQDVNRVDKLKEQQKELKLTSKSNTLLLDLEKEKATYNNLISKASEVNAEANVVTTEFNSSDAKSTVKDAKETIKVLKEAKAVNKKLKKAQKKTNKIEKKIVKLQARIDELNRKIKFVDQ